METRSIRKRPVLLLAALFSMAVGMAQEGWPVRFQAGGNEYQLFAPQPESMDGMYFTARAAISMKRPQDRSPIFGAIWADAKLELDRGSRLGRLIRFDVNDARFPGVEDRQELSRLRQSLSSEIPMHAPPISMDWLVAALEEEKHSGDQYVNDPPEIIYRDRASALVFIDGEPIYDKLEATTTAGGDPLYQPDSRARLERVLNTPFTILRVQDGEHYLFGSRMWFRSRSIDGPWQRADDVPAEVRQIGERVEGSAALTADDRPASVTPEIVVRRTPAELLDVEGAPQFQPVQNTSLLTLTNSSRSVFMDINSQEYYFLASGRWFRTRDLERGPWNFVPSDQLPDEFRKIPEGSNRDMVLAHVAGTDAARDAARDANIPQTAQVDRHNVQLRVTYQGSPEFERIQGTNVEFARNASTDVLRINGRYHVCDNGVWYEGSTPDGPWVVSTVVPAEVQTIPPSSPAYNTRYVYIYDHTPDIVYMGYTPGYMGSFVQHGVVVYGTGFYYRPWPGFWRPRPWTWGFNMYYDPWFGWGMGHGWGFNWIHPAWGMWGPHPYAWGGWWGPQAWYPPCCFVASNTVYGHRPSVSGRTSRSAAPEGTTRAVRSPDLYSQVRRDGVRPTTITRADAAQAEQPVRRPAPTRGQDHFTDAAGNVYRQSGDRTQRYDNGSWSRVEPGPGTAAPTRQQDRQQPVQRQPAPTREPATAPGRDPQRSPQARPDPTQIQRDRQRGIQRQQQHQQRTPPQTRPAPGRMSPPSPSRSPGVSPGGSPGGRGGGGGVAPSRGGGGGGGSAPSRGGGGGGRPR
jgi:hypothetical protein